MCSLTTGIHNLFLKNYSSRIGVVHLSRFKFDVLLSLNCFNKNIIFPSSKFKRLHTSAPSSDNLNIIDNQDLKKKDVGTNSKKENSDQTKSAKSKDTHGYGSTVIENELNKFRHIASSWWDPDKEFKPLHSLNKLRIALIRDGLIQCGTTLPEHKIGSQPLKGLKLLDVGCGGGILCEPLARLGATVVGLDVVEESLAVARMHAKQDKYIDSNISYINGAIEDHAVDLEELYDAVIASEVIEHVQSVDIFINSCINVLKPEGSLFLTTINRTKRSWLGAIVLGEYVLNLLPRGAHDWDKFITPAELQGMLQNADCSTRLLHGMAYIPIRNEWFWCSDSSINYALHAVKRKIN